VEAAEHDILVAIDRGERAFDWNAWFGGVDTAGYLTPQGRALASLAADLETLFGSSWLPKATDPASRHFIAEFGATSPLLALSEAGASAAYVETLRWWSSLQVLKQSSIPGVQSVLKELRTDITAHRLRHSLAQARLAAQGLARGAEVFVEPSKSRGGPGDVLIRAGGCEIFVEIVSSLPVPNQDELAYDDHVMWLWRQSADVSWTGYVPGFLNVASEQDWRKAVVAAVAHCLESGGPGVVDFGSAKLTAQPRADARGSKLIGPDVAVDQSRRLAGVIDRKAAQTRGAGPAWIWIEDHGGLHQLTPFSGMGIEDKLAALAELSRPLLKDRHHVAGIVWTRALRSGDLESNDVVSPFGMAFKRPLPGRQVRESIVVHRDLLLPEQLNLIARILDREPQWLAWALEKLGVSTLAQCLRMYPSTGTRR